MEQGADEEELLEVGGAVEELPVLELAVCRLLVLV